MRYLILLSSMLAVAGAERVLAAPTPRQRALALYLASLPLPERRVEAPAPVIEDPPTSTPVRSGVLTEADLSPGQMPTPLAVVGAALRELNPRGKIFVDIGCGYNCQAGIIAVRDFGATRVLAIEIDPVLADNARRNFVEFGNWQSKIEVINADAVNVQFPQDAVGFAALWPDTLAALRSNLSRLSKFVSFAHPVPGGVPGMIVRQSGDLYIYEKPAPRLVRTVQAPRAVRYGNSYYTGRVCGSRNCSMCNKIERLLRY